MLQKDVKTISDRIATYQENLKQLGGMLNNYDEPYLPQFGTGTKALSMGLLMALAFKWATSNFLGARRI